VQAAGGRRGAAAVQVTGRGSWWGGGAGPLQGRGVCGGLLGADPCRSTRGFRVYAFLLQWSQPVATVNRAVPKPFGHAPIVHQLSLDAGALC
jgi:hypothetical protein